MVFSLRQLQEESILQSLPLYVFFIHLTRAFATVSEPFGFVQHSRTGGLATKYYFSFL